MRWSPASRCPLAFACVGSLALTHSVAAQENTLALAGSAITPGEQTFTYAVPRQLGWFKREGFTVNLHEANASTAALQAVASGSSDPKGKRVGVISLASASDADLEANLEIAGLSESDVTVVPMGAGARSAAALESDQVDAIDN